MWLCVIHQIAFQQGQKDLLSVSMCVFGQLATRFSSADACECRSLYLSPSLLLSFSLVDGDGDGDEDGDDDDEGDGDGDGDGVVKGEDLLWRASQVDFNFVSGLSHGVLNKQWRTFATRIKW